MPGSCIHLERRNGCQSSGRVVLKLLSGERMVAEVHETVKVRFACILCSQSRVFNLSIVSAEHASSRGNRIGNDFRRTHRFSSSPVFLGLTDFELQYRNLTAWPSSTEVGLVPSILLCPVHLHGNPIGRESMSDLPDLYCMYCISCMQPWIFSVVTKTDSCPVAMHRCRLALLQTSCTQHS